MRTMTPPRTAALAGGVLLAAGWAARRTPARRTGTRRFHAVHRLPAGAIPAVWPVLQSGSLTAVGATAAAVGRRSLTGRSLVAGTATWLGAKRRQQIVERGRSGTILEQWRTLGRPQAGLAHPSRHAAVAASSVRCVVGSLAAAVGV